MATEEHSPLIFKSRATNVDANFRLRRDQMRSVVREFVSATHGRRGVILT